MMLYRTISIGQTILYIVAKICYVIGASIALLHYNENPGIVIAIIIVCLFFFIITGTDEIIVYPDSLEYKSGSIVKMFTKRKKYIITDIKSVKVCGRYSSLSDITHTIPDSRKLLNQIEIQFNNGEAKLLLTDINIDKLKKASLVITKLLTK